MSERHPTESYREPSYWDGHTIKDGHPSTIGHRLGRYTKSSNPIEIAKNSFTARKHNKQVYETLQSHANLSSRTPIKTYSSGETFDPKQFPTATIISFTDERFEPKALIFPERYEVNRNLAMVLDLEGDFDLHKIVFGLVNYEFLGPAGVPKIFTAEITIGEVNHGFYNLNRVTELSILKFGKPELVPVKETAQENVKIFRPAFQS